jgi:UDP-3-O-[3-hydroxymyristoyl] glucosamine N-acyltransferase
VKLGANVSIGAYAVLGAGVGVGAGTVIAAHSVIGDDCQIGSNCKIHPHVTLYPRVRVGDRTIIHSGARIGSDGYGYTLVDGAYRKVPQVGSCIIGSDVEIGANTTIDRGSIGATEVGDGVKIDNLVHLGHNVRVGDHTLIVAQVGVSGSTVIGSRVTLGGQVGVQGHIRVGDQVVVAGQSGVWSDLTEPGVYSGGPARPHKENLRTQAGISRVADLIKRVRALEQAILGKNERK